MMKEKNDSIETLLERFFEGQTSNEEEQQLYLFFKQKDMPEELVRLKPVIDYFENGLANECENPTLNAPLPIVNCPLSIVNSPSAHSTKKKQWILWSSIAASFLIILCTTFFFLNKTDSFDPLEGSYIIRNGVRITDLDLIRPELEATLQSILQQQEEWEQMYAQIAEMESLDIQILQQIRENNRQIVEDIQDENIRREVAEFFIY